MKNKFLKILLVFLLNLIFFGLTFAEEFSFEVSEIEILDNGNIYKGNNRGKIKTNNQIEITSDNFKYLKNINRLEANGSVELVDIKNNIIINADQIFYFKNKKIINTIGETTINISKKYNIKGYDLTFLQDEMLLSSNNKTVITDNSSNVYQLDEFEYLINQEILKGKKVLVSTNDKKNNTDQFFFETAYFDLKNNKFLAKDINARFHKSLFGNEENDPRISAVSARGDEFNTYFEKGIFTSCKENEKCPPWKIQAEKIQHDKIKKQIVYNNAWLKIYDIPVVYFPKFFHPDPTVKRQSGFLKPNLGSSKHLGNSVYTPYFFVISKDKDITIKPKLFDDNKIILQNEYRQKTKNSYTIADFSYTKGHESISLNNEKGSKTHFFINTQVDLDLEEYTNSSIEINYEKTSNDNYLKLFNLESPLLNKNKDVLESKVILDLEHQDYDLTASFEMYETLKGLNSDRYEYVLPAYNFSKNFYFEKINGSFNFNSYGSNTVSKTNITQSILSNDLNYNSYNTFFDNGIKGNFGVSLKNVNTAGKNSTLYKSNPQSRLSSMYMYNASLPLIKKSKKKSIHLNQGYP